MSEPGIDHGDLRDALQQLLDAGNAPRALLAEGRAGGAADLALWARMAELGWFGIGIDEDHGGLGLGLREMAILYEELGRSLRPLPVLETMLAASALTMGGSGDQYARWLPGIAAGDLKAATVLPVGERPELTFGEGGRLTGTVVDVPFADVADILLVPVCTANGQRAFAVLEPTKPGLSIDPQPILDLTRTFARLTLDDVTVADDRLVFLDDAQWDALLDHANLALACDAVGGIDHVLSMTVEYLKVREQFGRPLGSFQALKHRCANWKVLQEAVTALAGSAVDMIAGGEVSAAEKAASAKYYANDVYAAVAGDAIQLHGGIGFTWEHACHLFLKRAKLNQVLFGGSSRNRDKVARLAFGAARKEVANG
ncbi:MAG: acyl-CoA dehydrogenase family protein [Sphingomonadales bacterium]